MEGRMASAVAVKLFFKWDRAGGGQLVSVLAFYSDDQNSNPADSNSFSCKICV